MCRALTDAPRNGLPSFLNRCKYTAKKRNGQGKSWKNEKCLHKICSLLEIIVILHKNIALAALKDYVCRSSLGRCAGAIFMPFRLAHVPYA